MKPFRFGVVAAQARTAADWKTTATRLEAAGYASLLLPDGSGQTLAPFAALATAAAVTNRLHVGNWVLANDLRHPVLVAREAATLAFLSDGRLELGFGAGRADLDYAALGLGSVEPGGVRLRRLAESLQIIRGLFEQGTLSFKGAHYSITNATLYPRPEQRVPILMAAGGPRAVGVAGQYADIVAITSSSIDEFTAQVARLEAAAGDRFEQIELASVVWLVPEGNPEARQATEMLIQRLSGSTLETLLANRSPMVITGSVAGMVEQLQERRSNLGLSYIVTGVQTADWFAPVVERLAGT